MIMIFYKGKFVQAFYNSDKAKNFAKKRINMGYGEKKDYEFENLK